MNHLVQVPFLICFFVVVPESFWMALWQRYSTKSLVSAEADMLMTVKPDLNIAGSKREEHSSVSRITLEPVSVVSQH